MDISTWLRRLRRRGLHEERAALEVTAAFRYGSALDEMLTDAQLQAALTVKKFGVLDAEWQIVPGGEDEASLRAVELVRFALGQLRGSVTRILLNALDALAHGYSVQEINYTLCEQEPWRGMVVWQSLKSKPPVYSGWRPTPIET